MTIKNDSKFSLWTPRGMVLSALVLAATLMTVGPRSVFAAQEPYTVAVSLVEDQKAVFATVESVDVVAARARIGGTVAELAVDEGSPVVAGQLIARVVDQ